MPKRKASSSSTSSDPERSILWQIDSREMIPSEPKMETKQTGVGDKHQSKKKRHSPSFQKSKEMPKSTWSEDQSCNQAKNALKLGNTRINHTGLGASSRTTQQEAEHTAQSQLELQGLSIPLLPAMPHGDMAARQSYRNRHIVPLPVCEDMDTIQSYAIVNTPAQSFSPPQPQPSAPGAFNTVPSYTYDFYRPVLDADCYTCDATASSSTTAYNHDPNFDMDL